MRHKLNRLLFNYNKGNGLKNGLTIGDTPIGSLFKNNNLQLLNQGNNRKFLSNISELFITSSHSFINAFLSFLLLLLAFFLFSYKSIQSTELLTRKKYPVFCFFLSG